MLKTDLEKLIHSLSPSEKKNFKVYCSDLSGSRDYHRLFELFCRPASGKEESAEAAFRKQFPSASYENTAAYLFKVLTDMLVLRRINQDRWFGRHYSLMKARLCFERSLSERGNKELKRIQKQAAESQDHLMQYQAARMELTQLADTGFQGMNEQDLVNLQMKGKQTLQVLRQVHEHYSLYELLSHRLLNEGLKLSKGEDRKLNDLVLSELSLVTRGSQHRFESKKLHLLFQSFFFIHTGEYHSALKIFRQLNELIEQNQSMQDFPPYDYLSVLEGVLNSLRSINYYGEMEFFIQKTEELQAGAFPEHFLRLAMQTSCLYRLNMYIGIANYQGAITYFENVKRTLLQKDAVVHSEKHMELLCYAGMAYFHDQQWKNANKYISQAIEAGKNSTGLLIYRVCRMLYIIIHAEMDNMEYLNYEIRAYKRAFRQSSSMRIEKLLFAAIAFDNKTSSIARKALFRKKVKQQIDTRPKNRYEERLLQYFDFTEWISKKLS